jgi:hypothetical protein
VEGAEKPTITITVPRGTALGVYDVDETDANGLCGRLRAKLSGQCRLTVSGAKGMRLRCSGQSSISVGHALGDLNARTSGQSTISVGGSLGDVDAESSGQSSIMVNGDCEDFDGQTSGQSNISVSGQAKGRIRKRSSRTSRISVRS